MNTKDIELIPGRFSYGVKYNGKLIGSVYKSIDGEWQRTMWHDAPENTDSILREVCNSIDEGKLSCSRNQAKRL